MAYSKQNFQNGQILNAANLEKMENGIIAGQGAHNLLDNSDFRNPVNQRGATSYSTAGNEYTIDRWKTQYNTGLTIENGYINVIGGWQIYQVLKNPKDGVYTFAVEARINSIGDYRPNMNLGGKKETLFDANIGEWKIYTLQYDVSSITDENISFSISARGGNSSGSISVKWAAMYKGSYDASTLPAYQPKGYAAELAECQRYFERKYSHIITKEQSSMYIMLSYMNKRIDWPTIIATTENYSEDNLTLDIACWNIKKNSASGTIGSVVVPENQAHWYGYFDISADL